MWSHNDDGSVRAVNSGGAGFPQSAVPAGAAIAGWQWQAGVEVEEEAVVMVVVEVVVVEAEAEGSSTPNASKVWSSAPARKRPGAWRHVIGSGRPANPCTSRRLPKAASSHPTWDQTRREHRRPPSPAVRRTSAGVPV